MTSGSHLQQVQGPWPSPRESLQGWEGAAGGLEGPILAVRVDTEPHAGNRMRMPGAAGSSTRGQGSGQPGHPQLWGLCRHPPVFARGSGARGLRLGFAASALPVLAFRSGLRPVPRTPRHGSDAWPSTQQTRAPRDARALPAARGRGEDARALLSALPLVCEAALGTSLHLCQELAAFLVGMAVYLGCSRGQGTALCPWVLWSSSR